MLLNNNNINFKYSLIGVFFILLLRNFVNFFLLETFPGIRPALQKYVCLEII